jgi:hypothetical protein
MPFAIFILAWISGFCIGISFEHQHLTDGPTIKISDECHAGFVEWTPRSGQCLKEDKPGAF